MFTQLVSYLCYALAPKVTSMAEGVNGFMSPLLAAVVDDGSQPRSLSFIFATSLTTLENRLKSAQPFFDKGLARVQSIGAEVYALVNEFWLYKNSGTGDVQGHEVDRNTVEALQYPFIYHGITGLQVVILMLMDSIGVKSWMGRGKKVERFEWDEKIVRADVDEPKSKGLIADTDYESPTKSGEVEEEIKLQSDVDELDQINELYQSLRIQLDEMKKSGDAFRTPKYYDHDIPSAFDSEVQANSETEDDGYYTPIFWRSRKYRRIHPFADSSVFYAPLSTSSTASSVFSLMSLSTPELGRSPISTPASSPPSTPRCVSPSESFPSVMSSISTPASSKPNPLHSFSSKPSTRTRRALQATPKATFVSSSERAAWGSPLGYKAPIKTTGPSSTLTARPPLSSSTNKTRRPSPLGTSQPVTPEKKLVKSRDIQNIPVAHTSQGSRSPIPATMSPAKKRVWL